MRPPPPARRERKSRDPGSGRPGARGRGCDVRHSVREGARERRGRASGERRRRRRRRAGWGRAGRGRGGGRRRAGGSASLFAPLAGGGRGPPQGPPPVSRGAPALADARWPDSGLAPPPRGWRARRPARAAWSPSTPPARRARPPRLRSPAEGSVGRGHRARRSLSPAAALGWRQGVSLLEEFQRKRPGGLEKRAGPTPPVAADWPTDSGFPAALCEVWCSESSRLPARSRGDRRWLSFPGKLRSSVDWALAHFSRRPRT